MEGRKKRSYACCTPREVIRKEESCQIEVVAEAGAGVDWGNRRDMVLGRIRRTTEAEETERIWLPAELIQGERQGILARIGVVWSASGSTLWLWEITGLQAPLRLNIPGNIYAVQLAYKPKWLFPASVSHLVLISTANTTHIYGYSPSLQLFPSNFTLSTAIPPLFLSFSSGRLFMNSSDGSISEAAYSQSSWFSQTKRLKAVEIEGRSWTRALVCRLGLGYKAVVREIRGEESRARVYVLVETTEKDYRLDIYAVEEAVKRVFSLTFARIKQEIALSAPSLLPSLVLTPISLHSLPLPLSPELLLLTSSGHLLSLSFLSPANPIITVELMEDKGKGCKWLRNGSLVQIKAESGDIVQAEWEHLLQKEKTELLGLKPIYPFQLALPASEVLFQSSTVSYMYTPAARLYQLRQKYIVVYTEKRPIDQLKDRLEVSDKAGINALITLHSERQVHTWLLALSLASPHPFPCPPDEDIVNQHLSRVLRPIWRVKVVQSELIPTFRPCHYAFILENLRLFVKFMERYWQDRLIPFRPDGKGVRLDYQEDGLYQAHRLALRSMEVLALFETIETKYSLRKAIEGLNGELKGYLKDMRYREFLSTGLGQKVCEGLIEGYARQCNPAGLLEPWLVQLSTQYPSLFPKPSIAALMAKELLARGEALAAGKKLTQYADLDIVPRVLAELRGRGEVRDCVELCLARIQAVHMLPAEVIPCVDILTEILSSLNEEEGEMRDWILASAQHIDNKELHHALFHWIIASSHASLLDIQPSQYLLPFLDTQTGKCLPYKARVLMHRGHYGAAFEEYFRVAKAAKRLEICEELLSCALLCVDNQIKREVDDAYKRHLQTAKKEVVMMINDCKALRIQV